MFRTIVVIICEIASRTLEPLRSDWANRAYCFFEDTRVAALMKQKGLDPSHCSCEGECDGCPESRIWLRLADGRMRSWCGCAEPGKKVLRCGHCGCGNSDLCWKCVVTSSGLEKHRKASCA